MQAKKIGFEQINVQMSSFIVASKPIVESILDDDDDDDVDDADDDDVVMLMMTMMMMTMMMMTMTMGVQCPPSTVYKWQSAF